MGGYPFPVMSSDQATLENERRWEWGTEESGDRQLRSSAVVIGYYIAATDGELGHVEDFLVDDATWSIRYMVVDTSNWWFGKKVLASSEWITRVVWNESLLHVDMTREQIKNSPEYDPSGHVQREYEMKLHDHTASRAIGVIVGRADDRATVVRSARIEVTTGDVPAGVQPAATLPASTSGDATHDRGRHHRDTRSTTSSLPKSRPAGARPLAPNAAACHPDRHRPDRLLPIEQTQLARVAGEHWGLFGELFDASRK